MKVIHEAMGPKVRLTDVFRIRTFEKIDLMIFVSGAELIQTLQPLPMLMILNKIHINNNTSIHMLYIDTGNSYP